MEKEVERLKTEVIAKLVKDHEHEKQEFEALVCPLAKVSVFNHTNIGKSTAR